jgi:aminopeptidase N
MTKRFSQFVLLFLLLAASSLAQPYKVASGRVRAYDVRHYVIRLAFDHDKKQILGDVTIRLTPLKDGLNRLELDAARFDVESVRLDGAGQFQTLRYEQISDNKLAIQLDRAYKAGEMIAVRIKYKVTSKPQTDKDGDEVKPALGAAFIEERSEKGALIWPRQVWTQGQPEDNHLWMPMYDYPDDKATSEQFITVPNNETAIGNGALVEVKENGDGTRTFHFKMEQPFSSYLISFVVGDYLKFHDKYRDVPLSYYMFKGTENTTEAAYGKTKKMLAAFERLLKYDYPYAKYDQTIVSQFAAGGMENMTATTMADSEILAAQIESLRPNVEDLVAHELAHSWFGNLVTCKTWSDLWLNEGFATFFEAVFKESEAGRAAYLAKVKIDAQSVFADFSNPKGQKHALVNRYAQPNDALFSATTYKKGGSVVYMLREQVGDEAFWKALNIYLNRHKFGNVETADLQKAMEEASGQNLDTFFNQWVYGIGFPDLKIRQSYNKKQKQITFLVEQKQPDFEFTPPAYRLDIPVEVTDENGKKANFALTIWRRKQTFNFPLGSKPQSVKIDPDEKIILKKVDFK